MPPITILSVDADNAGGWLVYWRDESNLDGEPLEATTHVTWHLCDELEKVREQAKRPPTKMVVASWQLYADELTMKTTKNNQRQTLKIPTDIVPYSVRDWCDGYAQHIQDIIAAHQAQG